MNISLRSQMVVGIAALSAAAVAITPIVQQDLMPSAQATAAAVQLSSLANPVTALLGVVDEVAIDIFDQYFIDETGIEWPDNYYGSYGPYAPLNFGIIPDAVNQFSTGPLSGLVNNLSGYGFAAIRSGVELGGGIADSLFNTPGAIVTAVQQLVAGNPEAAIAALVTGIVDPIKYGIDVAVAGAQYIIENALENVRIVVTSFLPYLTTGVVGSVVGGITYMAKSIVETVKVVFQDLAQLDIEGAWNAAVDGFLGPNGTLGQAAQLTVGIGIVDGDDVVSNPSLRSAVTSELQRLGGNKSWADGGITNDPFFPPVEAAAPAAVKAAAAADAAPSPAALASAAPENAAPASEAPAADAADLGDIADAVESVDPVDNNPATAAAGAGASASSGSAAAKPAKRAARAARTVR